MYCVIWVVLPEPVSPMTTRTWFSVTALISSFWLGLGLGLGLGLELGLGLGLGLGLALTLS